MEKLTLYTIGFTKKSAESFFSLLRNAHVKRVIDIRLNNVSQLAGFTKKDDLIFFLREICQCDYIHEPICAPSQFILDAYRKKQISWVEYERIFKQLMQQREIEKIFDRNTLDDACLLCSEPTADKCHRRLVVEYLREKLGDVIVEHL